MPVLTQLHIDFKENGQILFNFQKINFFAVERPFFTTRSRKIECLVERRLIKYTFVGVYLTTEYVEIQYIGMIEA